MITAHLPCQRRHAECIVACAVALALLKGPSRIECSQAGESTRLGDVR
jgi:hypothetical protein